MGKILKYLPSILFNAGETVLVALAGRLIGLNWIGILGVVISFTLIRMVLKKSKHYKKWQLCLIWTTAVFSSLFLVCSISLLLSILLSIFAAVILSGHADITDMYQWSPHVERKNKLKAINTMDEFESLLSKVVMKPKYKELLRLLYLEDMTLMQAAEKFDIEYPTVKVWHGEALAKLAPIL